MNQARGETPALVATDLDGTLLCTDGTVSARTQSVLKLLDQQGVPVVFVTARPLRWMDHLWPLVGSHGLAIVSNGAVIKDVAGDRLIEVRGIEPAQGLRLVEDISKALPEASYAVETVAGISVGDDFPEPEQVPAESPRGAIRDIWTGPAVKLMVRAPAVSPERLRSVVIQVVSDRATVTWSGEGLMEISAPGVTKSSALFTVADRLGVSAHEVVAFGDMPNDLPMLEWAGTVVAVANADPAVRAVADLVTATNDEDGVAQALISMFGLPG